MITQAIPQERLPQWVALVGRRRRRRTLGVPLVSLGLASVFVVLAAVAELVAPHSPYDGRLSEQLRPPIGLSGGSPANVLGTDSLGRDVLSRMIFGARVSLVAAASAILMGGSVGTFLGLISGYHGGLVDSLIMRSADAMFSFPVVLLALLLASALGPTFVNLIIVLGLVMWARFARLVRGEVLSLKERDFVLSARVIGCSASRIMYRHILLNLVNALVVLATIQVGWVILVEASLSYLGAGVPPPQPSWGSMVVEGKDYIVRGAWWLAVFPTLAIVAVVMAFNLFGDWLRDVLDPRHYAA